MSLALAVEGCQGRRAFVRLKEIFRHMHSCGTERFSRPLKGTPAFTGTEPSIGSGAKNAPNHAGLLSPQRTRRSQRKCRDSIKTSLPLILRLAPQDRFFADER